MVTRRRVLIAIGLAVAVFGEPPLADAAQKAHKTQPATVTLKIDGMG